jgi:hypothetical protein
MADLTPKLFKGNLGLLVWLLEREKCFELNEWAMLEPDCILLFTAFHCFLLL